MEVGQLFQEGRDVVADADHLDVVAARQQRARDVVLGLLDLRFDRVLEGGIFPLGVRRVEDHRDLHASARLPPLFDRWMSSALMRSMSRRTVVSPMSMTTPPSTPTAGNSSIAVRRLPVRSDR